MTLNKHLGNWYPRLTSSSTRLVDPFFFNSWNWRSSTEKLKAAASQGFHGSGSSTRMNSVTIISIGFRCCIYLVHTYFVTLQLLMSVPSPKKNFWWLCWVNHSPQMWCALGRKNRLSHYLPLSQYTGLGVLNLGGGAGGGSNN